MGLHQAVKELSYSRLSSYESCARAFWHQYVDRTEPDGYDRIEGWMGSRVHDTLEWALKETLSKRVPDPVEILQRFENAWNDGFNKRILITKPDLVPEHYKRIGKNCLKTHLDEEWPFLKHQPLAAEERVEFPVNVAGSESRFLGYVDRIDRANDGRVRIVDYKTGAWVPDFNDPANTRQLALYWHALKPRFSDAPEATLVWHYLQKQFTHRVPATDDVVALAVAWVEDTANAVNDTLEADESKDAFPAAPSQLCKWCNFGYACDANPFKNTAPKPARTASDARITDY